MARALKFWHQYGFLVSIIGYIFMMGTIWQAHNDAIAHTQEAIDTFQKQHDKENMDIRVVKLEQMASDTHDNIAEMKNIQSKIFERINQLADKR